MLTSDAISYFKNRAGIAKALQISRTAVSRWGEVVPEGSAYKLQAITGGSLVVRPEFYLKDKSAA